MKDEEVELRRDRDDYMDKLEATNAKLLEALKCCRVFIPPSDYLNNTIKEAEEATP